jgi:hypothetical protein
VEGRGALAGVQLLGGAGAAAQQVEGASVQQVEGHGAGAQVVDDDSCSDSAGDDDADDAELPGDVDTELPDADFDDADLESAAVQVPLDDAQPEVPPVAVSLTLLSRALQMVRRFQESGRQGELRLPPGLSPAERSAVHNLAGNLGLSHVSEGVGPDRQLVIGRMGASAGAPVPAVVDRWKEDWWRTRTKYDPRHW